MKYNQIDEMSAYIGDIKSAFGLKEYCFTEGKARGLRALDMNNGKGIAMTVMLDKCLDIPYLSFKGHNIGFVSKTGIVAPSFYKEEGTRGFLKQFEAGFLTTCGITYAGAPCTIDGREYGLHGNIYNCPAENVTKSIIDLDGQVALRITGEIREACVFEENMLLQREIILETETNTLRIHDLVRNCGFSIQPVMNVYHMNYGFPMLQKGDRIITDAPIVVPRDSEAEKGQDLREFVEDPTPDYKEQCFFHMHEPDTEKAYAALYNPQLGIMAVNHYNPQQTPILCEWKNMQSGDYALGLEPTACGVMGKAAAEKDGTIKYLEPGRSCSFDFRIEFLDDPERIKEYL